METQASSSTLLEVKHLSVDYYAANGTVHAVTDVSFTLQRGEILGIAGESGCGKSTLAYAIARLLHEPAAITGGEVLYYPSTRKRQDAVSQISLSKLPRKNARQGETVSSPTDPLDILQFSPAQLRKFRWNELSIVFQSAMNALNPVLNIGTQIMDVLKVHQPTMSANQRKQRAIELLNLVGIPADRLRSYPHELSGGMRQRAMIAIALALSPELIIMDEPTTALDVVMQRDILNELMNLRKLLNFSVIFITHDLSLLLEMADKIVVMYAGRIVEMATAQELYRQPRHPYTYGLLNSFPTLHGPRRLMTGIPGSPPDLRAVPPGCSFHPRCPFAFNACNTILPLLQPATSETPGQLVACHLYNAQLHSEEPPTNAEFAARYAATGETLQGIK